MDNEIYPVVLSTTVKLIRNFVDLPFPNKASNLQKDLCIQRVIGGLEALEDVFICYELKKLSSHSIALMAERELISETLEKNIESGVALITEDKQCSVLVNDENQIVIKVKTQDVRLGLEKAHRLADAIEKEGEFAYDESWGYLTARPEKAGVGLEISYLFHLPLYSAMDLFEETLTAFNTPITAFKPHYKNEWEADEEGQGHSLYCLSVGDVGMCSEDELVQLLNYLATHLTEEESILRAKLRREKTVEWLDRIYQSFGILRYARRMTFDEFELYWQDLRFGASISLFPLSISEVDALYIEAQNHHLLNRYPNSLLSLEEMRSNYIRSQLMEIDDFS